MDMAFIGFNEGFATAERDGGILARLRRDLVARLVAPQTDQTGPRRLSGPDPRDAGAAGYLAEIDVEMRF
jgi:hypothetical protein